MTVAEQVSGSQTCTLATEHTLAETGGANNLPVGKTYVLALDVANIVASEILDIKIYTKTRTGDTARLMYAATIYGVQGEPNIQTVPIPTAWYTKFTITQNQGTGRAIPWAVYSL